MKRYAYLILVSLLFSCAQEETIQSKEVILELPATPFNYLGGNEAGTLGRVLFYDQQLSVNNAISCASCHKQSIAFGDNRRFSRGFENLETERNSMPIQNLSSGFFLGGLNNDLFIGSATGLFWDGRGTDHNTSVLLPVVNHIEMGISDLNELADKLSQIEYYPDLFTSAFGDEQITPEKIGFALQAFTHSITSNNTKFDRARFDRGILNGKEEFGRDLFMNKYDCNACHQVQDPQGYIFAGTFANIGLENEYEDAGLELTTNRSFDNGKFKIPSLRNVALTAPYMHDGRFATLEEVIEHYNTGVVQHPNLDSRLRDEFGAPKRPNISENEVQAIIAFLGTMTDYEMISDERFSNPFSVR